HHVERQGGDLLKSVTVGRGFIDRRAVLFKFLCNDFEHVGLVINRQYVLVIQEALKHAVPPGKYNIRPGLMSSGHPAGGSIDRGWDQRPMLAGSVPASHKHSGRSRWFYRHVHG